MAILLTAASLLTPHSEIPEPQVTIEEGAILGIESGGTPDLQAAARRLDFPGALLVPAYFDVHIHGAMGHDVMEGSDAAFDAIGRFLAARGVGAYLPTTVTAPVETTLHALQAIARQIERANRLGAAYRGARPLGIHLEGPFLSHDKRGVHPPEFLATPSAELLQRFWQAAEGRIRLMTVAPELPGAVEMIEHAVALGIRVSLGHSNATRAQAEAGVRAGARSATHTFNAMRALDHREPGLLGVVLDDPDIFAELICDGVHVDPLLVRLFYRAKGAERGILVTDAMSATGMPEGIYRLGAMEIEVSEGRCLLEGKLAGSVLTLERAVRNFVSFTGAPYGDAVRCATANPSALAGFLEPGLGQLRAGGRADIVVLSPGGEVLATLLRGEMVSR